MPPIRRQQVRSPPSLLGLRLFAKRTFVELMSAPQDPKEQDGYAYHCISNTFRSRIRIESVNAHLDFRASCVLGRHVRLFLLQDRSRGSVNKDLDRLFGLGALQQIGCPIHINFLEEIHIIRVVSWNDAWQSRSSMDDDLWFDGRDGFADLRK